MSIVKKRLQDGKNIQGSRQKKKDTPEETKQSPVDSTEKTLREFDMFKLAIESDLAQLKTFSDLSDKTSYKSEAIKKNDYLGYLERYRTRGDNHPNIVLVWIVIWLVDLRRWKEALEFLPLLVEQQQRLPVHFNTKDWPTFFIDQLYDEGNKHLQAGRETIENSNIIKLFNQVIALFEKEHWKVNEVVGGKLFAMAAKLEKEIFNLGNALSHCITATGLNDSAGVKKLGRDIAKQIGKEVQI